MAAAAVKEYGRVVRITSRLSSDVVIVDICGRLDFLDVSLHEHISELLAEGHRAFVLNLENVPYVDSFGLGQLIAIWVTVRDAQGQLILLAPAEYVGTLLHITKLDTVFPILCDETNAIKAAQRPLLKLR